MDANYWIKVPQSVNLTQLPQRQQKTNSSIQWCQNSDLNCRKTEKSSQTKLATGAYKSWIFFAVDNFPPRIPVTIFPLYRAPVAGQPDPPPFGPCCSCSFLWTRDAFHKFSQSYDMVGLTAGQFVDLDWTFWSQVNTEMARQFWQDLQVCMFLLDSCLCAKGYFLYADRANRVCFCRGELGSDATCVCQCVCLRVVG